MTKTTSYLCLVLRVLLLWRFFREGNFAAVLFGLSEFSVLFFTLHGLLHIHLSAGWKHSLVPILYLMPLILSPEGPIFLPAVVVLTLLCVVQIWLRAYMGINVTAGAPMYNAVIQTGPWSFVRHPLALCEMLIICAFCLSFPNSWNTKAILVCLSSCWLAILLEEHFLFQFRPYRDYMRRVRYRLIPRVL